QLLYQSELITNQSFMGLHGKFQISIALEKLLSDSGLTYRKISNTTYTVHKTRKRLDDSTHIDLLSSSAPNLNIPEIITTGQSRKDGCCLDKPNTASKATIPDLQLPKSAESIDDLYFQESANLSLSDAFRDFSSVVVTDKSGNLSLRGFNLEERSLLVSGIPIVDRGILDVSLNNVAGIEIAKGASSALYGYGQPNGLINLILKEPQPYNRHQLMAVAGNQDTELALDFNRELNHQLWGRLVVMHKETKEEKSETNHEQFAPSFRFESDGEITITLGLEWNRQSINGDEGLRPYEQPIESASLLYSLLVPRSSEVDFYPASGAAPDDEQNFKSADGYIDIQQPLANDWQHHSRLFYGKAENKFSQSQDLNIWLNTLVNPRFGFQPLALIAPFSVVQNRTNAIGQYLMEMENRYAIPDSGVRLEDFLSSVSPWVDETILQNTRDFFSARANVFDVMSFIYGDPFENIDGWGDNKARFYYYLNTGKRTKQREGFESNFSKAFRFADWDHELLLGVSYFTRRNFKRSYLNFNGDLYQMGTNLIADGEYQLGFQLRRQAFVNWYDPYGRTNYNPMQTLPTQTALELGNLGISASNEFGFDNQRLQVEEDSKTQSLGFYLQDHVKFNEQWMMLAAIGFYHYQRKVYHRELNTYAPLSGEFIYIETQDKPEDNFIAPSFGLTFLPWPELSLFSSYSKQYDILEGASILQESFEPEETSNYELGFKWRANNSLNIDFARYHLIKENWLSNDATSNGLLQQQGELINNGYELSIGGLITPYLEFDIYYAQSKVETKQQNAPLNRIGQPERNAGASFTFYASDLGSTSWSFSLGLEYLGTRDYNYQDLRYQLDSSTLLNLTYRYHWSFTSVTLALDNVTDETWYVGSSYRPVQEVAPNYLAQGYGQRFRAILQTEF
ncbi:MAG: TonB-dependent receptor, partial [Pseudomonadales bacterium]|nr:TonB-dependent receptor [Pseudomonadales bacterium]